MPHTLHLKNENNHIHLWGLLMRVALAGPDPPVNARAVWLLPLASCCSVTTSTRGPGLWSAPPSLYRLPLLWHYTIRPAGGTPGSLPSSLQPSCLCFLLFQVEISSFQPRLASRALLKSHSTSQSLGPGPVTRALGLTASLPFSVLPGRCSRWFYRARSWERRNQTPRKTVFA